MKKNNKKDKKSERKKDINNKTKNIEKNNKTKIDYNELFLSYEETNVNNEIVKDYDENKSLIFI